MDEEKRAGTVGAEAPGATAAGNRKKGTRLWTVCLLLGLALALLVSAALLFTVRVGGRFYLCADTLDLRERELSCADLDAAVGRIGPETIRWSVPIGGERFDSFSETLTLSSLPKEELGALNYFPRLKTVDARSCPDAEALAAAARLYEDVDFLYTLESSDGPINGGARALSVQALSRAELEGLLPLMPRLETVDLREAEMPGAEADAFMAAHPELDCPYSVSVWGQRLPGESESLRFESGSAGTLEELTAALPRFRSLRTLDLRDSEITPSQLTQLLPLCADVELKYVIRLYGRIFTAESEEIDLSGVPVDDTAELEAAVGLMPKLKKVVMCDCGVPDEKMAALGERYAPIRFVWMLHFSVYSLRTDATYFCASDLPELNYLAPELNDAQIAPIRYCTDLVALDLGHMHFTDLSFLYNMPHLKYLILVEGRFTDITPIGSLEDLEYLELFKNKFYDISPLLNCKKLKHLNLCYTFGYDPSPLRQMKSLERLWCVGSLIKEPLRSQLIRELDGCYCYFPRDDRQGSTGGGWRENEAYYEMRDVFGMYYQPGGTGIH